LTHERIAAQCVVIASKKLQAILDIYLVSHFANYDAIHNKNTSSSLFTSN